MCSVSWFRHPLTLPLIVSLDEAGRQEEHGEGHEGARLAREAGGSAKGKAEACPLAAEEAEEEHQRGTSFVFLIFLVFALARPDSECSADSILSLLGTGVRRIPTLDRPP
jgi:hypothetical protein